MGISEKVAYLKGLAEGLKLDAESNEGKLFAAIIDVLEDMADEIADMQDEMVDLEDGLDAVSDDLSEVEESLYELEDEDEDEWGDDEDEEDCFMTTCPECEGLLRRVHSGGRRSGVPQLRHQAGVRPQRSGQRPQRRCGRGRGSVTISNRI